MSCKLKLTRSVSLPVNIQLIGKDVKMFHFWFHTSFVDSPRMVIPKSGLDKV